ncbi:Protein kinase-like (PK-like) [Glarea lozoyensis ATCC 20868]|uniref:Protein kinase-like (PK-like) n=1 Tax=Glarea lozoyensis (strain ATCC 20868 / MF5171) TaxID=1116229 RepID=S3D108_GLAL2|nr:Protein kinase-like (PK-like) [Glarea lozoyensis ATCC 20868]EPE32207.1 Protein kinase-like (PK-like) [Glarea lozoyensis ATCC 20868]
MENAKLPKNVIRDRRALDNTFHPGIEASDLVHKVHGVTVYEPQNDSDQQCTHKSKEVLCRNCDWNDEHESKGNYTSRLKVMYCRKNSAIWELGRGGPWLMKDYPNEPNLHPFAKDYTVRKFIREKQPNVPVPESFKIEGPDNKFTFEIVARVKGVPMESVFQNISVEETDELFEDLDKHMKQWRQITSPQMGSVDGSELLDGLIGCCRKGGCIKTGINEEEWLENLTPAMRKGILYDRYIRDDGRTKDKETLNSWVKEADEQIAKLKASFPKGGPYVLTHCDLHFENIFVSNENEEKKWKVTGIIDWETAGFYPWWAEAMKDKFSDDYFTEIETEKFKQLSGPVKKVIKTWRSGGDHTMCKHGLDEANSWHRKPFCSCQPYDGSIKDDALGWEDQGHADVFDADSEDSEFDDEKYGPNQFDKEDRGFLRWFKEISTEVKGAEGATMGKKV